MRRKTRNITLSIFGSVILSASLFVGFKNNKFVESKADPLSEVGVVSITGMEVYHPYTNGNEFVLLDLIGTDYPTSGGEKCFYEADVNFDFDLENTLYFYDLNGTRTNTVNYFQVYSRQHGENKQYTFSIWLENLVGAKKAIISENFKIPSYAYLTGDTSSPTYGYYSLDREYVAIAEDINYTAVQGGKYAWEVKEENYDQTEAYIINLYSYVDGEHEMLTFQTFGTDVDYDVAPGNSHFDKNQVNTQLPNFKNKVHLYDENRVELEYNLEFISTINLWEIKPTYSVGIDVLRDAKFIYIEDGLILPSYANLSGNTSSPLYDGFVIQNEVELGIDETKEHTTGARIQWVESLNIIEELTIAKIYTNSPHGNTNEFFCITFVQETDFADVGALKWDSAKYTLMKNFSTHYHLYNSGNAELSHQTHDIYYCYSGENTGRNSISIMTDGSGLAVRAVLNKGLLIPSYALYCGDKSSNTYGYYSLKIDCEATIEEGHSTHLQYESIKWNIPSCQIEYYDENNNLISSLNDDAALGSNYYLKSVPEKSGYIGSWEIVSPAGLEIVNNRISIPLVSQTIKLKATYTEVKMCTIQYLNDKGEILPDLTEQAMAGSLYALQPLVSKKGHDAAWEIVSPDGMVIVNNQITLPNDDTTTITIQAKYTVRTYLIYFEGATNKEVTYNEPIGELPVIPNVDGKTGKWIIDEEFIDENTIYIWDENKAATSTYIDKVCVISFNTNGGEEMDDLEYDYGQPISELPTPTREGYLFNYWAIDEGGLIPFALNSDALDDLTLYATWLKKCLVKFDSNGGSLLEDVVIGEGQKIERQPVPTRDGYRFIYWTLNDVEFNFSTKITGDVTLVAKWEKIDNRTSENEAKRCGGNIVTTSIILSLVSLTGVGALLLKRKTEK